MLWEKKNAPVPRFLELPWEKSPVWRIDFAYCPRTFIMIWTRGVENCWKHALQPVPIWRFNFPRGVFWGMRCNQRTWSSWWPSPLRSEGPGPCRMFTLRKPVSEGPLEGGGQTCNNWRATSRFVLFFLLYFLLFCSHWAKALCFEGESPGGKIRKKCAKVWQKIWNDFAL